MKKILIAAIFTGCGIAPGMACGEDIETITVVAARIPISVERAAAAVTVLDRQTLDEQGLISLDQALPLVPGAAFFRSGGFGSVGSLFLRGANSNQTLVLFDGVPIHDASVPNGAYDFGYDLTSGLSRIEIARGPASSVFGSQAIGGVVDLLPRTGRNRPYSSYADFTGGSFDTFTGSLGGGGQFGAADFAVDLGLYTSTGYPIVPERFGAAHKNDGAQNWTLTASGGYDFSQSFRLDLSLRHRTTETDLDQVTFSDPNYTSNGAETVGVATATWQAVPSFWQIKLKAAEIDSDRGVRDFPSSANGFAVERDSYTSARHYADLQNRFDLSGDPDLQTTFVLGGVYDSERANFATYLNSGFGPFTQALNAGSDTKAGYAEIDASLWHRIDINVGVRHEDVSHEISRTSYRLGGVVTLVEGTRLVAIGGSAFRAPALYDRYAVDNFGFHGNPALRPELSESVEAGIEQDVWAAKDGKLTLGARYFNTAVKDLIVISPDFTTEINTGRARMEGYEFTADGRLASWASVDANLSLIDARDRETGLRLLRRPYRSAAITLLLRPAPEWLIAPQWTQSGERADIQYANNGAFLGQEQVSGVSLFNIALRYRWREFAALTLRVDNLADRHYEFPTAYAQPGRTARAGVELTF